MSNVDYDVVIIGAGISGLTAALRFKERDANMRIIVLEAKDRVGGRTCSIPLRTATGTDVWDVGSQWVSRSQNHIMDLLSKLELDTYSQYNDGTKFLQIENHPIRAYTSSIPSLSWIEQLDLMRFMAQIDRMRLKVPPEDPYSCEKARLWDAMTLETFKQQKLWTSAANDVMDAGVRTFLGVEPSQVSLLFFLMYINSAGGLLKIIQNSDNTANELKIKGGAQQICNKLWELLGDSCVLLKQPVTSIKQDRSAEESEAVIITTESGSTFRCKRVVITVPPNLLGKIKFEPSLPIFKRDYIRRAPLGNKIKVIFSYREAFWRDRDISGEILSSGGPSTVSRCDSGPLCYACDATSADGNPAISAFIAGHQAVQWSQLQRDERIRGVLESLSRFLGPDVFSYIDCAEKDWNLETYSEGGNVCVAHTGAMRFYNKALRQPFGKVHFGGTETATVWIGYMSGSVQAGLRAASEVLRIIKPEVVCQEDLDLLTSVQPQLKKSVRRKAVRKHSWVKWTLGIGSLILIVLAVRKSGTIKKVL